MYKNIQNGDFSIVMLRKHPFLQDCILFDINSHSSSDDFIHLFRWDSRAGTLVSKHLRCENCTFLMSQVVTIERLALERADASESRHFRS